MTDNNNNNDNVTLEELGGAKETPPAEKNDVAPIKNNTNNIVDTNISHDVLDNDLTDTNNTPITNPTNVPTKKSPLLMILVIVLILIAVGAGVWWYITQYQPTSSQEPAILYTAESVNEIPPLPSETPTVLPTENSDAQSAIETTINQFFQYLSQKDRDNILAMFTPATNEEDIGTYNFFIGKDMAAPTLFGNASTGNFEYVSHTISDISDDGDKATANATLTEKTYSNGTWYDPKTYDRTFELVKIGNQWKVDKYYGTQSTDKYGGFYVGI